ncbi:MAG: hypothetical protein D6694_15090 [Gammaproteobacteria bacterium]|nr:MAG: hypothetical protein D6694_15090 [Gammaproteobacteria bacterium]
MAWRVVIALSCLVALPALPIDVGGVRLQEMVRLSAEHEPVKLNGAAVRRFAAHPVYVGGLYLTVPATDVETVINAKGAKRIFLICKTSAISSANLRQSFEQGLAINNPPETLEKIHGQVQAFLDIWRDHELKKGDSVWIDFIPGQGTRVYINQKLLKVIPGKAFYDAFLRAWLGKYPINPYMKKAMLQGLAKN